MPCFSPLMGFQFKKSDGSLSRPFFSAKVPELQKLGEIVPVAVPCGRCIGCRLENSRQWAMRCVFESKQYEHNSFITLTYDENHIPKDYSLKKVDFQNFMKRLREHIRYDCKKRGVSMKKIRFFACGEYGEHTFRPHYHAIIFNHKFDDEQEEIRHSADGLKKVKFSPTLTKIWGKGITSTGEMTFESAAYVARYCLKKVTGPEAEAYYFGCEPEFSLSSRNPGIAYNWFKKYKNSIFSNGFCVVRGKKCKPPPYFDRLLEKVDEELFKLVKGNRRSRFNIEEFGRGEMAGDRRMTRQEFVKLRQKKIKRGL